MIVYPNGNCQRPLVRYTVSYPKWLMEKHIGRKLEPWETVDHINRDFTDDRIENLQILERAYHTSLDTRRARDIEITCVWCGEKSFKAPRDLRGNFKQGKAGPFCGKSCSGKYGAEIQNKRLEKLPRENLDLKSTYFKKDK